MQPAVPRSEHPRPQFVRADWVCLNGLWSFEIDQSDTGLERGLVDSEYQRQILVPYAPESTMSGIGVTDFLEAVWYRRVVRFPRSWRDKVIHLNFQAVDYDTTVWINGVEVGRHRGGSTPFTFEISGLIDRESLEAVITVRARDPRGGVQPRGKQATWFAPSDAYYTRTTGIWQTVWAEATGASWMERPRIRPCLDERRFDVEVTVRNAGAGMRLVTRLLAGGELLDEQVTKLPSDLAARPALRVPADRVRPWAPRDPFLYEFELELRGADGGIIDAASSYAGLRSVAVDGKSVLINGRPVFQRLVLDQGYWPDSLMTAPSDEALERDIQLALEAGFNGARLHQKVFEERFLFHADRLGYLVWSEFGDWGASGQGPEGSNQRPTAAWVAEWLEVLERDMSHPSIIGWCPLNETHQLLHDRIGDLDDVTSAMFRATKLADPTRPVIDASGYSHRVTHTDIWDSHVYDQDPGALAAKLAGADGVPYTNDLPDGRAYSVPYSGQPYFISEFGGIWWQDGLKESGTGTDLDVSWGYGSRVASIEDFYERFAGLTGVLLAEASIFGYCYTQLTDVMQEKNGIYAFDRSTKFDVDRIRTIQQRPAAYELDVRLE